ncbi:MULTISPECIES: hypothetical protein [Marinomonas]|uniref:Uncharacterized protein n=1 Tax=Marinomonas alcarazii TaxID=491949 RepID=A0A318V4E1_9GAMM|nr:MULTISPECIES: hypothetical protein [Marinomonas]PYF83464.1 hypothetical protein DFP75_102560 [Marinomonas alcarazii]
MSVKAASPRLLVDGSAVLGDTTLVLWVSFCIDLTLLSLNTRK